jgi:hypothetical protein
MVRRPSVYPPPLSPHMISFFLSPRSIQPAGKELELELEQRNAAEHSTKNR